MEKSEKMYNPASLIENTQIFREQLANELNAVTRNEYDHIALEKFKKGFFLIPSETTKRVSEMLGLVVDQKRRDELSELYHKVMSSEE